MSARPVRRRSRLHALRLTLALVAAPAIAVMVIAAVGAAAPTSAPARASAPTSPPPPAPIDPTPLLTYKSSHHYPPIYDSTSQYALKNRLRQIAFDLSKDPPPDTNCAQTLGAKRFAFLLDDLGGVYSSMGEDDKAAQAYERAIACNPRAEFLHTQRAAALLGTSNYDEARREAERQLRFGRANFALYSLLTQLDFIQERWQDAIMHARLAVAEAPDDEQAAYWQCFLWLAQKRSNTSSPVLVNRHPPGTWPAPILDLLQGKISETEVTRAIDDTQDIHRQHEILTEALFYTGQKRMAEDKAAAAAEYFAAAVDLQVPYFIEHHLAMAELTKLRRKP